MNDSKKKQQKKLFEKQFGRFFRIALLKSALSALAAGCFAVFVGALVGWFIGEKALLIALVSGGAVMAVTFPLFYFFRYRPNPKEIARRLDRTGLDERLITMLEFENDDSYLANLQRQDAKLSLRTADPKKVRLHLLPIAIVLAVAVLFGSGMTTFSVLSEDGRAYSSRQAGRDRDKLLGRIKEYEVIFEAQEGGIIEGDIAQVVEADESTTYVVAVADAGWAFAGWVEEDSDEILSDEPVLLLSNVQSDRKIFATFQEAQGGDGSGGDGDSDDSQDGEQEESEGSSGADDKPQDENESPDNSSSDDNNDSDGKGGDNMQTNNNDYVDHNKIIDNETYYRDVFEQYYEDAINGLNDENLTPEQRKMIELYLKSLR